MSRDLAAENIDLRHRIAGLEQRVNQVERGISPQEQDALMAAQARADAAYAMFGLRASAPATGEPSMTYRKRLLEQMLPHSPMMRGARLDSIHNEAALGLIERHVYADATAAAREATNKPGILVPRIRKVGPREITEFEGDNMAWMQHFMTNGARCKIDQITLGDAKRAIAPINQAGGIQ